MKIEQEKKEEFIPVKITIETQEEFDKIYAIFDNPAINRALDTKYIFDILYDLNRHGDGDYGKWFNELNSIINK